MDINKAYRNQMEEYLGNMNDMTHILGDYILPKPLSQLLGDYGSCKNPNNAKLGEKIQNLIREKKKKLKPLEEEKKNINKEYYDAFNLLKDKKSDKKIQDLNKERNKKLNDLEKEEKNINNEFYDAFNPLKDKWIIALSNNLVVFYKLRYVGSRTNEAEYLERLLILTVLFWGILGNNNGEIKTRDLVIRFFKQLKDYLLRVMPGIEGVDSNSSVAEVLKAAKERYETIGELESRSNENKVYINFNKLRYSKGLIDLLDEVAKNYEDSEYPLTHYHLILSECLYTLFIYVFMCEYVIYAEHNPQKPNLLQKMSELEI